MQASEPPSSPLPSSPPTPSSGSGEPVPEVPVEPSRAVDGHVPVRACPACDYDLSQPFATSTRVMCPECGNRWSRAQVDAFLSNRPYWGPIPKIMWGLPVAMGLWALVEPILGIRGGDPIGRILIVVPLYVWPCMTWLAYMNSRRRHGDFSIIVAACLGVLLTVAAIAILPLAMIFFLAVLSSG